MHIVIRVLAYLLVFGLFSGSVPATPETPACPEEALRVGLTVSAPMVMQHADGTYYGIAVDSWEKAAHLAQIASYCYVEFEVFEEQFPALGDTVDVLVGGLTMLESRERQYGTYTKPTLYTGLRVLAPREKNSVVLAAGKAIFSRVTGFALLLALSYVIVVSVFVWRLERRKNPNVNMLFISGMLDSIQLVLGFLTTWGDKRKNPEHRVTNILIMPTGYVVGVFLATAITMQALSTLTVELLRDNNTRIYQLADKRIAVKTGTAVISSLKRLDLNITPIKVGSVAEAVDAVQRGIADAVVYDETQLRWHLDTHPLPTFELAGPMFEEQYYAFMVRKDSRELLERLDLAILALHRNKTLKRIYNSYVSKQ